MSFGNTHDRRPHRVRGMKALVAVLIALAGCNSVTVVPIDDEDAGDDAGADAPEDG